MKKSQVARDHKKETKTRTPTFLLELPLVVNAGQAKRVRLRSRGRGLSSIENKRNDTGLRFALQDPKEGSQGWLIWKAETVWQERGTASPRDVYRTPETHLGLARAAP